MTEGAGASEEDRSDRGAEADGLGAETDEAVVAIVTFFMGVRRESAELVAIWEAAALVLASDCQRDWGNENKR